VSGSPALSVVIPTLDAEDTLPAQLEALLSSPDADFEVVVVENGSTDGTRALAERFAAADPRVRVVDAAGRRGEAHARNAGCAAARSECIAFCDADDVAAATWVAAMTEGLQSAEYVTGPVELDRLNPPWLAGFRGRTLYEQLPRTIHEIPFAHGCNIGVRKEVVERLGGFTDLRAGTDVDFAIRAWRAGVQLSWREGALIHYRHRLRSGDRWRQGVAYGRAAAHLHSLMGDPWTLPVRLRRQLRRARWLIATVPWTVSRAHRARWLWTLALVTGELRGRKR
jgi:glycosyltransferase involved in cell wall biosynthesis